MIHQPGRGEHPPAHPLNGKLLRCPECGFAHLTTWLQDVSVPEPPESWDPRLWYLWMPPQWWELHLLCTRCGWREFRLV